MTAAATMLTPLRCVFLYSAGHLGSSIALNLLHRTKEIEIVGVVRSEPAAFSKKGIEKLRKQVSHVGWQFAWLLLWQRFIQFLAFHVVAPILSQRQLYSAWQIANRMGLPSLKTRNVNNERGQQFLRSLQPDLLISAYFSQILKKPVLDIPKQGALNIHPGFLPDYKGAMNYFWVIRNGEDKAGVTVHWMDEGIDTGALLARKSFAIPEGATQQQVLAKSAIVGARLTQGIVHQLQLGKLPQGTLGEGEGNYYSVPTRDDFKHYYKRRRYFRIRNILGLVVRRWH